MGLYKVPVLPNYHFSPTTKIYVPSPLHSFITLFPASLKGTKSNPLLLAYLTKKYKTDFFL